MTTIQEAFGSEGPAVEHGDTSSESIIREAVSTRRIVKLSEETINRIAAGEVGRATGNSDPATRELMLYFVCVGTAALPGRTASIISSERAARELDRRG